MYIPAHFEESRVDALHQFVRDHPFGLLVTQSDGGLDANPIPFLLDQEADGRIMLRAHVARANPVWREARTEAQALVVFQGADAYVSPSWYPAKAEHGKVVPTWNYLIVQARGQLAIRDDAVWLRALVERLTQTHEAAMPQPWALSDAPPAYIDTMLRAIVGIEIDVSSLRGKWKMSQNRSVADREGVAKGLRERGDSGASAVADWIDGE